MCSLFINFVFLFLCFLLCYSFVIYFTYLIKILESLGYFIVDSCVLGVLETEDRDCFSNGSLCFEKPISVRSFFLRGRWCKYFRLKILLFLLTATPDQTGVKYAIVFLTMYVTWLLIKELSSSVIWPILRIINCTNII